MTVREEIEAIINTHSYKMVVKCCNEQQEINESLESENKRLRMQNTRLRNKLKDKPQNTLETDILRLREQNKKIIKERDMYKRMYTDLKGKRK